MDITYIEKESITYEVIAEEMERPGYLKNRVMYRFWPIGDGDWKLQIIDGNKAPIEPIVIPKKVIDKILNVNVKGDLKK
jgi:hypothetical protein